MARFLKSKRPGRRTDSRERQVLKVVRALFPRDPYYYGAFISWLPGVTGEPLQLDIFFPQIGQFHNRPLAIEVQGDQHRKRIKFFQKTKDDFTRQVDNDALKKSHLVKRGIPLLEIWPEDDISPDSLLKAIKRTLGLLPNAELRR